MALEMERGFAEKVVRVEIDLDEGKLYAYTEGALPPAVSGLTQELKAALVAAIRQAEDVIEVKDVAD